MQKESRGGRKVGGGEEKQTLCLSPQHSYPIKSRKEQIQGEPWPLEELQSADHIFCRCILKLVNLLASLQLSLGRCPYDHKLHIIHSAYGKDSTLLCTKLNPWKVRDLFYS